MHYGIADGVNFVWGCSINKWERRRTSLFLSLLAPASSSSFRHSVWPYITALWAGELWNYNNDRNNTSTTVTLNLFNMITQIKQWKHKNNTHNGIAEGVIQCMNINYSGISINYILNVSSYSNILLNNLIRKVFWHWYLIIYKEKEVK